MYLFIWLCRGLDVAWELWLILQAPNEWGLGSIPGQGTRSQEFTCHSKLFFFFFNGLRKHQHNAGPSRSSVQFSSVTQSWLTLCDPMNRSMPGLPVHHQLLEFTQTHVHRVGDAIQPSHPLSSPSPPAPNPSQHQSLFQ